MKRVLITGANGFTGRVLKNTLSGQDADVEVIPMVQEACGFAGEVVADFCDDGFHRLLLQLQPVDAVVHLGTRVGWDGSTRADLFKPNVLATAQLVEWAQRNGSYFVFASAALIAGTDTPFITAKNGPDLQTDNDYLYSKWLTEQIIKMSGVKHAILRISGIFGKDGPSHLGINNAIRGALNGIPPVQYGDGNIKRNYIYVKDLCAAIRGLIHQPVEGTLLAAGSFENTIAEMLEIICRYLLPGSQPDTRPGSGGFHQVIEPSRLLPGTRSFEDAVKDILHDHETDK
jgi:UDP-glucose 4-epimerase